MRRTLVCALVAAGAAIAGVAPAQADVATDVPGWFLTGSTSTYGGGTQYHTSTGSDGIVSYRWLDSVGLDTIISGNSCSDGAEIGSHYYNAGVTVYRTLFSGAYPNTCFVLKGRTAGGGTVYANGRVLR